MWNSKGLAVVFLLTVTGGCIVLPGPVQAATPEVTTPVTKEQYRLPPPTGRLKFKSSGPVCMCAEGMSERDIEQAMAKLKAEKSSGSEGVAKRSQESSQETSHNLGVTK
jgi:hypothetical protein